jgi:SAM-dependent methyltransferase
MADTDGGVDRSRQVFLDKWGFDRIAPDLDVVRQRYAGTPLLWNANVFGSEPGDTELPPSAPPTTFDRSEWVRFNQDTAFQAWTQFKAGAVLQVLRQTGRPTTDPVAVLGCGSGIVVHLLALQGLSAIGVERDAGHIRMARQFAEQHQQRAGYPGQPPRFEQQTELRAIPLADGSAPLVCLFDRLEAHDNPPALLREAKRIAGPRGAVLVISKCVPLAHDQPMSPYHPYLPKQMASQVKAVTHWPTTVELLPDQPGQPMVVFATGAEPDRASTADTPAGGLATAGA